MVKKGGLAGNGARGQRRVNDRRHEPSQCPQVLKVHCTLSIYIYYKFDVCFIIFWDSGTRIW